MTIWLSVIHMLSFVLMMTLATSGMAGSESEHNPLATAANQQITIPAIGETITTDRALGLCRYFALDYLVERIGRQRNQFHRWVFDGASMLPDGWVSDKLDIPHLTEIALRHDLKYAYGDKGNDLERLKADLTLKEELIADGASPLIAAIAYWAVRIGGGAWTHSDFSWGFARK